MGGNSSMRLYLPLGENTGRGLSVWETPPRKAPQAWYPLREFKAPGFEQRCWTSSPAVKRLSCLCRSDGKAGRVELATPDRLDITDVDTRLTNGPAAVTEDARLQGCPSRYRDTHSLYKVAPFSSTVFLEADWRVQGSPPGTVRLV